MKINLLMILGTDRLNRQSERVFTELQQCIEGNREVEVYTVDPRDYQKARPKESDPQFKELAENADAYMIVTPEYNRGYPGSLKNLLDSEYDAYNRKPVALVGVSSGDYGGRHVVEHLQPVLRAIGMSPIRGDVLVGNVDEAFDEQGNFVDKTIYKKLDKQLEELIWHARALKKARINNG